MAISKLAAALLAGTIATGGVVVTAEKFNIERLENVKANFTQVESSLKGNETKLLAKYSQLHTDAKTEIQKLETEKVALEDRKAELEVKNAKLQAEIDRLMNTTVGSYEKQIAQLKLELQDAEAEIDWLDAELVKYDEMLEEKHQQLIDANLKIEELQEQVSTGDTQIQEALKALQQANNEITGANQKVEELRSYSEQRANDIVNEMVDVDSLPSLNE